MASVMTVYQMIDGGVVDLGHRRCRRFRPTPSSSLPPLRCFGLALASYGAGCRHRDFLEHFIEARFFLPPY
jgi:hypothetical protein